MDWHMHWAQRLCEPLVQYTILKRILALHIVVFSRQTFMVLQKQEGMGRRKRATRFELLCESGKYSTPFSLYAGLPLAERSKICEESFNACKGKQDASET